MGYALSSPLGPLVAAGSAVKKRVRTGIAGAQETRLTNAIGVTALASSSNNDSTARAWGSIRARGCGLFRASARGLLGTRRSGLLARGRVTATSRLGHSDGSVFGDGGRSGGTVTTSRSGLFLARVRSHGGVLGDCASAAVAVSCCEVHFAADTTAVRAGWEDFEVLIVGRSGSGRETGCDEGKGDRCKSGEMHCLRVYSWIWIEVFSFRGEWAIGAAGLMEKVGGLPKKSTVKNSKVVCI
ncbi:hypothetical protein M408DRAFT_282617 [Serendipita vermifera MAFF 305830]|uniref:Uncharacterized protein n=1 Tax=Serendipita vermifera MAFF 305830 TaxID=933852 RepID=A0A0C2WZA4_SERVB|nr:hypothetical protein M408DRAFT_282617 [Serendipita vermifera MAFF 305830]